MKTANTIKKQITKLLGVIAVALFINLPAPAGTHVWKGGGANKWSTVANWASGGVPSAFEAPPVHIVFPTNGTATAILDIQNLKLTSVTVERDGMQLGGLNGCKLTLVAMDTNYTDSEFILRAASAQILPTLDVVLTNTCSFELGYGYTDIYGNYDWIPGALRIESSLQGPGNFHLWAGFAEFAGTNDNTHADTYITAGAQLVATKTNAVSLPGKIIVNAYDDQWNGYSEGELKIIRSGQTAGTNLIELYGLITVTNGATAIVGDVNVHDAGRFTAVGGNVTFNGDVTVDTEITTFTGNYTLGLNSGRPYYRTFSGTGELCFEGPIAGPAAAILRKAGDFTLILAEANSYAGPTFITGGQCIVKTNATLGSTAGGTTIIAPGELALWDGSITSEPLTLIGGTNGPAAHPQVYPYQREFDVFFGKIEDGGNCTLLGPVVVDQFASLGGRSLWDIGGSFGMTISNSVTGAGSLTIRNGIYLALKGSQTNSFSGGLNIENGVVRFSKAPGVPALNGPLTIGDGADDSGTVPEEVTLWSSGQIPAATDLKIVGTGRLVMGAFATTVHDLDFTGGEINGTSGVLTLTGNLTTHATNTTALISTPVALGFNFGDLEVADGAASPDLNLADAVSGGLLTSLTKYGTGELKLGGANTYAGWTYLEAGKLLVGSASALGSGSLGTVVRSNTVMEILTSGVVFNEPLFLQSGKLLQTSGTNTFGGAVQLDGDNTIETTLAAAQMSFTNVLSGAGAIEKRGTGSLRLGGASANTYLGDTFVVGGTLILEKSAGPAISGGYLAVGFAPRSPGQTTGTVDARNAGQIGDTTAVNLSATSSLLLNGWSDVIGSLSGAGTVTLGNAQLTLGGLNTDTTFAGAINGSGATCLVKNGSGTFTLGGNNAMTGKALVQSGKLIVNGAYGSGAIMVNDGATLAGSGTVSQIAGAGGVVSPGNSPGLLKSGNVNWTASHSFKVELNGPVAGQGYDQLGVIGTVNLGNAALNVSLGFSGSVSNHYVILDNNGAEAVTGTFAGLPEGATLAAGGAQFRISYAGGSGNDVVLTQLALPAPSKVGGLTKLPNGQMQINGTGVAGLNYTVEANADLTTTNWMNLGTVQADANGAISFTDANAASFPMRFYRFKGD